MTDHVDRILQQWATERPDLDVSPMAVIGRLSRTARQIDRELNRIFTRHNMDAASFDVLATLRRSGDPFTLSPRELSQSSMVTTSAIAQRLNRLEERQLISRSKSGSDGRGILVSLTRQGRDLIDNALPDHVDNEHRLIASLSGADRAALAGLLEKLDAGLPGLSEPHD